MTSAYLRLLQPFQAVLAAACLMAAPVFADEHGADEHGGDGGEKNPVLATVNGEEIHRSDVDLARSMLPERYQGVPLEIIYSSLVDQVIDSKLVEEMGRKEGLESDPVVVERIKEAAARIIQQAFLTRYVSERLTEEALRAYYDELVGDEKARKQVRARHILVETEGEALELIDELESGADFEELAREKSIAPEGAKGGDLGYFSLDQMVPEFAVAAFTTPPGEMTPMPVQTSYGWHVIKVEDSRLLDPPEYEDILSDLESGLSKKIMGDLVAAQRRQAEIVFFNLDGLPQDSPVVE